MSTAKKTVNPAPTELDAAKMAAEILKKLRAEKANMEFVNKLRYQLGKQAAAKARI